MVRVMRADRGELAGCQVEQPVALQSVCMRGCRILVCKGGAAGEQRPIARDPLASGRGCAAGGEISARQARRASLFGISE
jgi:hypothetical protein